MSIARNLVPIHRLSGNEAYNPMAQVPPFRWSMLLKLARLPYLQIDRFFLNRNIPSVCIAGLPGGPSIHNVQDRDITKTEDSTHTH